MSVKSTVLGCLLLAPAINAQDLQRAAGGLAVNIETLEGTTHVNGLPIVVARAVGPAVPALARNVIAHWREMLGRDSVRNLECCGWKFASVLQDGESRVIQWRSTAAGFELLWSSTRISATVPAPARTQFPLLTGCRWTTPIHGRVADRHFAQISAHCRQEPHTALDRFARQLGTEGWRLNRRTALMMQAERKGVRLEVVAGSSPPIPGSGSGGSSLMLVESHTAEAGR